MNTIFTHLNNIVHYKKFDPSIESDNAYNPYMINRWISMYSPQMATIVNHTVNMYWTVFTSKHQHNKFISGVIPKSKVYRINYIKKSFHGNSLSQCRIHKLNSENKVGLIRMSEQHWKTCSISNSFSF